MSGRPALATLALCVGTFGAQTVGTVAGLGPGAFALSLPLSEQPWTLATSVYAHGSAGHLLANGLALLVVGPLVAYVTTGVRFHAFFLATGAVAGVVQIVASAPFGGSAVLGASGAIFALLGYLFVGNRASERVLAWLPLGRRGRLAVFVALAALLTAATAAPGVALVAHFVGFCLGAAAGRFRVLHVRSGEGDSSGGGGR
ncbi:probable rhomboid family protease [Natronomonas moolapensis 8.8.11]|uniref:Probable rhomboid family protease n=1 Tax=Natronomonas moolapensis (strain DSM 18674 / CECT 7526 / JCM 14361 / 8.8.11) TaxID=268739 RepID=M1Y243_NATM8|nr:rhomboid family intramembrane serine protease [Natronomonas moolapensis]CCQ36533.1 probable rhomboid family protease [Natronomonas moolapensis 8.8.11]